MNPAVIVATLARRGLLNPGSPARVGAQLWVLLGRNFSLAGELRQAAARSPRQVALIDEESGEITYGELRDRAGRLAAALHATGVTAGQRVGLLCRNHAAAVEMMIGACQLGVDTVLVNTGLSAAQLTAVAEEHNFRALVYDDEFAELVAGIPESVMRIGEQRLAQLRQQPAIGSTPPEPKRDGRTIVLTSGTTGVPKGARRPTPQGLGPLVSIIDRIPLRAKDRVFIAAPLFHTWGYAALQLSFGIRATIVLQRRFDPAQTHVALIGHRCDALFAVPVMLQRMLEAVGERPAARPPLRVVAISGSALPGHLATRFMDTYGDVLYNLYGSTEASWASIATPADLRKAANTAGRPPRGTRVAILDHHGKPVPTGEVGRVFVGNDMLFEGYTSGAGRETHGGLLATGDLGHVDSDGLLYVDGREDDMIVSGGENVFPSEVENLLTTLPQVREVAVVGVPDAEFGQRLVAFVSLNPGQRLTPEAVREYTRHYLARYAVPRDVHFVESLPRNATGKVLTRTLLQWTRG